MCVLGNCCLFALKRQHTPNPGSLRLPDVHAYMNHRPLCQTQEVEGDIRRILEKISIRTNPAFIAEFGDDTLWPIQT